MTRRPRVAVSECLLGSRVRYDGRIRRDPAIADELAAELELIPVCPEVGVGMPVPRDPLELRGDPAAPRMIVIATGEDVTATMERWITQTLDELAGQGIAGLVLKGRSPSCGPHAVPVVRTDGRSAPDGVGLFARSARKRWPTLPIVEAETLIDPRRRAGFLTDVLRHRPG